MSSASLPQGSARRISAKELAATIHARDLAAFFVEPRVLRRVIKVDRDIHTLGLQVPHASSYVIARSLLRNIVDADELHPADGPPDQVLLLPLPEAEELAQFTAEELVARYERLWFHARVHLALEQRVATGHLGTAAVRERICRLGQTEFEEARSVLRADDLLLPPRDDLQLYIEFAAMFLELHRFAPDTLPHVFPAVRDHAAAAALFAADVAGDDLLSACWQAPATAPSTITGRDIAPTASEPKPVATMAGGAAPSISDHGHAPATPAAAQESPQAQRLLRRAEATEDVGNLVHGAILRVRAAKAADSPAGRALADDEGLYDLSRLAERLQRALGFDDAERHEWEALLRPLLRRCADDRLTVEGRILYDLQKVCVDHEREIFTVDVTEWLLSLGRQPIRRPLPALREALTCKHLRRALVRLRDARLSEAEGTRATALLEHTLHAAEEKARQRLRSGVAESLCVVGIKPSNVPEEIARHKIVEELLDKAVESGYLRFGDLRDAISRNNLKLPDLVSAATPREMAQAARQRAAATPAWFWLLLPLLYFWRWLKHLLFGDHLLRADRQMADRLDGVYHRAEVYLRLFQRITSLGFGSGVGRALNRYLVLPLLAAFMVVAFYQEVAHLTHRIVRRSERTVEIDTQAVAKHDEPDTLPLIAAFELLASQGWSVMMSRHPGSVLSLFALGIFFLGLINSAALRRWSLWTLVKFAQGTATAFRWFVAWLARPVIQAILYNPWIVLARRFLLKPALFTALVCLALAAWGAPPTVWAITALFLGFNLLLNSRLGRNVEEISNDWLAKAWLGFQARILSGLYWLIVDLSKAFLEGVDRLFYAADEWLRFRHGETRLSFTIKAVLGAIWFVVTYVVRFAVNLLIEPQINPLKHFPVVTVSHKVVLALAPTVGTAVAPYLGWEPAFAIFVCGAIGTMIPGIFGFLAWELKENWKLYTANRPDVLRPVRIGHHGETMARLLRPGFHSGTLPKLFRKLRRAQRKAGRTRQPVAELTRKPVHQLHEVRHAVTRYVEREFLYLLEHCPAWRRPVALGQIELATNRIRIEVRGGDANGHAQRPPCWLSFEEQHGWLLAHLEPGWITPLPAADQQILRDAFLGLYKTAGVELVHQQLRRLWQGEIVSYRMAADDRLTLWPNDPHAPEITYRLDGQQWIEPQSSREVPGEFTMLRDDDLRFDLQTVTWEEWVAIWDGHQRGTTEPPLLKQVYVVPDGS